MEQHNTYITLQNLEVYQLARDLSRKAWSIYEKLNWQTKKVVGDQFLESTDSTGANLAEGYGRFHYLDKVKFYYNSRGSLMECSEHWVELLLERKIITEQEYRDFKESAEKLLFKLNIFIATTYKAKSKE